MRSKAASQFRCDHPDRHPSSALSNPQAQCLNGEDIVSNGATIHEREPRGLHENNEAEVCEAHYPGLVAPRQYNGAVVTFFVDLLVATLYIVVSLLTCRKAFDMDRLLHRGRYAVEKSLVAEDQKPVKKRFHWSQLVGFDDNFTFWDKIAAGGIFWWAIFWFTVVLFGTAWNLWHPICQSLGLAGTFVDCISPWPQHWWTNYWLVSGIGLPLLISVITLVWFGIGGVKDLKSFFIALRTLKRDDRDDGRVVAHHNLADEPETPRP